MDSSTHSLQTCGEASLSQVPHPMALLRESRVHVQRRRGRNVRGDSVDGIRGYLQWQATSRVRDARESHTGTTSGQVRRVRSVGCCRANRPSMSLCMQDPSLLLPRQHLPTFSLHCLDRATAPNRCSSRTERDHDMSYDVFYNGEIRSRRR